MSRSVSIANAKAHLPQLVQEVERGQPVELTRRGRPVAVLLSLEAFRALKPAPSTFWDDLSAFRARFGLDVSGVEPAEWPGDVREECAERDFEW